MDDNQKMYQMPEMGLSDDEVRKQVDKLFQGMTPEDNGKFASTAFWGVSETNDVVKEAFLQFFSWNALFTFQEASAAQIENDVLDVCIDLVGGNTRTRANLTSGGTESNFCALHAMRKWAREKYPQIKTPEIVAPYSTHATIHKACKILDIRVVTVPQLDDLSADVVGIEKAIGDKTIGIVGSAPSWPYGQVDPIAEFSRIAMQKDIWLHVDACVGAYVLPFFRELGENIPNYDLTISGVRSITGDLHKYGYTPKPCSTVLWRSQEEQKYHLMPINEWACGTYLSQGFVGSRPLAPVAAAWALMLRLGRQGYLNNARKVLDTRNKITEKVMQIPGLKTWISHGPLLQIASENYPIELVIGGMAQKGWRLLGVNNPPAIHLTIDVTSARTLDRFMEDLELVARGVSDGTLTKEGLLEYGGTGDLSTAPKWLVSALEIMGEHH